MRRWFLMVGLVAWGCGDDGGADPSGDSGSSSGGTTSSMTTMSPTTVAADSTSTTAAAESDSGGSSGGAAESSTGGGTAGGDSTGGGSTTGVASNCDYEVVDGLVVIEAEDLPIVDEWTVATAEADYYGEGYIDWTGSSSNNTPGNGLMEVTIFFEPGRYRLIWRNQIGMGNNTTEHNDTWVSFPDVAGFFGRRDAGDDESRVYPRPLCEDGDAMMAIADMAGVTSAGCPNGTSSEGWFKVYSSGANDWSWSTFTSDNDAHQVVVEVESAGDYTMMLSQRADRHLIDRIVLYDVTTDIADAQAADNTPTACR